MAITDLLGMKEEEQQTISIHPQGYFDRTARVGCYSNAKAIRG